MKWNFNELLKYKQKSMKVNEELDLEDLSQNMFGDVILSLSPVQVVGQVQMDKDDIIVHAKVVGKLTTPSTRSNVPVEFPFDFIIDEVYVRDIDHIKRYESETSVIVVEDDVINFNEVIVQYIFLQIPLRILADDEDEKNMPIGDGWKVMSEDDYLAEREDYEKHQFYNTPLANLTDLLADDQNNN